MQNGTRCKFWPTASDLQEWRGCEVTVLRPLREYEADLAETGPMYAIRMPNGWQFDAFEDELQPINPRIA